MPVCIKIEKLLCLNWSSIACSPVKQELDKDNKDTDQHDHAHQDEAPTEHGETVGLWLTVLVEG